MNVKVCSTCGIEKVYTCFTPRADRPGKYMSSCKSCRQIKYSLIRPKRKTVKHASVQDSLRYHKIKRRIAELNSFICDKDEFNLFAIEEAHNIRKLRNALTGLEWHVDHVIPLRNKLVCGLHLWTNLRVVPAKLNWSKNNAFYG